MLLLRVRLLCKQKIFRFCRYFDYALPDCVHARMLVKTNNRAMIVHCFIIKLFSKVRGSSVGAGQQKNGACA